MPTPSRATRASSASCSTSWRCRRPRVRNTLERMSRNGRLLAVAAALVVLAIAFVVLSPGGDDEPATTGTTARTTATTTPTTPTSTAPAPPPAQQPKAAKVVVRDGKPAGGMQRIEVKKGERA